MKKLMAALLVRIEQMAVEKHLLTQKLEAAELDLGGFNEELKHARHVLNLVSEDLDKEREKVRQLENDLDWERNRSKTEYVRLPQTYNVQTILTHLKDGLMIDAIKELRCMTGFGLKEAKDACQLYVGYPAEQLNNPTEVSYATRSWLEAVLGPWSDHKDKATRQFV